MPAPKADALVKSVKALLAEREALTAKERELVRTVNSVLNKMGYRVVPLSGSTAPARGRRGRRAGRRPGRTPGGRGRLGRGGVGGHRRWPASTGPSSE